MFGSEFFNFPFWGIFPLVMTALCFFMCFFGMKGRMCSTMCGFDSRGEDSHHLSSSDSAMDKVDKRYALDEINKEA